MYGTSTPNSDVDLKGIFIPDSEMEARPERAAAKAPDEAEAEVAVGVATPVFPFPFCFLCCVSFFYLYICDDWSPVGSESTQRGSLPRVSLTFPDTCIAPL